MINRKCKLGIIIFYLFSLQANLFGQQYFLNNQRNWNDLMFNPAKIVETNGNTIYTSYRRQFVGLGVQSPYLTIIGGKTNLPVNYSLNMLQSENRNKKQNYNLAVGTYYIHSNYGGVFDQNEICGQFAFQLKFDQNRFDPNDFNQFNLGIAVKGINMRYRGSGIALFDPIDPVFNQYQAENSFSIIITPGFHIVTRKVDLDALLNIGSPNQKFASFTLSGSGQLDNVMRLMSLRINYFNEENMQLSLNKIIDFKSVFQHNWAINFGVNSTINSVNSDKLLTNPGVYLGFIYRANSEAKKTKAEYKKPLKYSSFSGSLNLFDANINTISLGPSSEIGLLYSRNTKACECDQIYDVFLLTSKKLSDDSKLTELKQLESNFTSKCNTREYQLCFVKYRDQMRNLIKTEEANIQEEEEINLNFSTRRVLGQEWYCSNLDYYKGTGIRLITNQADWDRYSPTTPCCCYVGFDEKNKNKGLCYNKKAYLLLANSQELKNSKFRIATVNDWDILNENAKKSYFPEQLYNCDGKNPNGFNIQPSGYYEYDWMYLDMAVSAYWVGESEVYWFDCNAKEGFMILDIDNEAIMERNDKSAFMIRLIQK